MDQFLETIYTENKAKKGLKSFWTADFGKNEKKSKIN